MRTEGHADRDEDFGAPTPERAAIANGSLHKFPVYENPNSRVIVGYAHLIASPVRKMFDDGRIGEDELTVAGRFQRDYVIGSSVAGLTMKYGERMGSGGTPISQQANTDRTSPDQMRSEAHNRFIRACDLIGHKPTVYWLTAVVCEVPVGNPAKVPSLEEVGRAYQGYDCRKRAQAAGATIIKMGLERLAASGIWANMSR